MSPKMLQHVALVLAAFVVVNVSGRVAPLANCPLRCECDDDTLVVSCGQGSLDVLPIALNPSIRRLIITDNKIKTIDSSIQFYAELQHLDLSSNQLLSIPARTFHYQRKLQELHLHNNKIGMLTNRTFAGLPAVTMLNLRTNLIGELAAGTFALMPQLTELNLGQNQIASVDARAFEGLSRLRILYLDDNELTRVPSAAFAAVAGLAELYMGMNVLSLMADDKAPFANLRALNELRLQSAGLHNISAGTFRGLEHLRVLDVSDNRLQRIPTVELSSFGRLEELHIGQNDFAVIPEGAFAGMTNLRSLYVSGSLALIKVQAAAFSANKNLESITLSANKRLAEVQEGAFSGLPHLRHVVLRDNGLTTLTEGLFPWAELATFDLSENPIHCDCRVMWLRNLLLARHASALGDSDAGQSGRGIETLYCATPERLREEPLNVLSAELLGCVHLEARQQAMLGVVLVISAAFITALLLIGYKCRAHIWVLFKGRLTTAAALGRKEQPEYQKTCTEADYARFPGSHPCGISVHHTASLYNYPQLQLQQQQQQHYGHAIPVTEL